MSNSSQPVFYDTTLRDGNQSLKRPWNPQEKLVIFKELLALGIQAIELGFPASSKMDFDSCCLLVQNAPKNITLSVLARIVPEDIMLAAQTLQGAAQPRIHIFAPMNPEGLQYILHKSLNEVADRTIQAVKQAKFLLPPNGQIEFSVEHFGDCKENLQDVIQVLDKVVQAGATIINLPNTVERSHPMAFVEMVKQVKTALAERAQLSVHCHNDLGMATATTVESFFAGATQLETTINGLGERCGKANMLEVALALYNSGVDVSLNMRHFYQTALIVSELSGIPIWEKAPLMGRDCFLHRSGIHQDGATKTKALLKGQYLPYQPELIGRTDGESFEFTSQSGKAALKCLCSEVGISLSPEQLQNLVPKAKHLAEEKGELSPTDVSQLCLKNH